LGSMQGSQEQPRPFVGCAPAGSPWRMICLAVIRSKHLRVVGRNPGQGFWRCRPRFALLYLPLCHQRSKYRLKGLKIWNIIKRNYNKYVRPFLKSIFLVAVKGEFCTERAVFKTLNVKGKIHHRLTVKRSSCSALRATVHRCVTREIWKELG
jgi:hypothetical protein